MGKAAQAGDGIQARRCLKSEGRNDESLAFLTSVPARKTSLLYKGKNLHLIQCNPI